VLLELVWVLPQERYFHEARVFSLEALRLATLAPTARRALLSLVVPTTASGSAGQAQRSAVAVLLAASAISNSAFFQSDPEVRRRYTPRCVGGTPRGA
jgi:hypothetical protein